MRTERRAVTHASFAACSCSARTDKDGRTRKHLRHFSYTQSQLNAQFCCTRRLLALLTHNPCNAWILTIAQARRRIDSGGGGGEALRKKKTLAALCKDTYKIPHSVCKPLQKAFYELSVSGRPNFSCMPHRFLSNAVRRG